MPALIVAAALVLALLVSGTLPLTSPAHATEPCTGANCQQPEDRSGNGCEHDRNGQSVS